jgi:hypothetical protein
MIPTSLSSSTTGMCRTLWVRMTRKACFTDISGVAVINFWVMYLLTFIAGGPPGWGESGNLIKG